MTSKLIGEKAESSKARIFPALAHPNPARHDKAGFDLPGSSPVVSIFIALKLFRSYFPGHYRSGRGNVRPVTPIEDILKSF